MSGRDENLRALERAVAAYPLDGLAKLRYWTACLRVGQPPVTENQSGDIPDVLADEDWAEAFGAACGELDLVWSECVSHGHGQPQAAVPGDKDVAVTPFAREDVRYVLASAEGENDSEDWVALVMLWDGRFATVSAGCDYTGWG